MLRNLTPTSRIAGNRRTPRRGAVLTVEMLLVIPLIIGLILAVVEFSMIWSGNQKLAAAARAGCRVATLPGSSQAEVEQAVQVAINHRYLSRDAQIQIQWGEYTGDPVVVEVRAPMRAASPDMLALIGLGLGDRQMTATSVMRRE